MAQDPLDLMYRNVRIRPREAWMDNAMCRGMDPEIFYPNSPDGVLDAKEVCAQCTVCPDCLDYAIRYEERKGIWGGTSERVRRELIQEHKREQKLREPQSA